MSDAVERLDLSESALVLIAVPPVRRVGPRTLISYSIGAVAYGIKDSGFGTFLLIFYNQVIGLDSAAVGLVVMIALFVDAFVDPAIGVLSDRTRTRWGRRHPWMYASALPIVVGWLLLWHPPQSWGHEAILLRLFVVAVLLRTAISAYEVPSQALTPELTADYDERTRVTAWRYLFGWVGGLGMLLLAYGVFLAPAPGIPNGLLNRSGYTHYAVFGAVVMGIVILVSCIGTHREIPNLPQPAIQKQTLRSHWRELGETVRNRAFVILMLASVCGYTSQGISYSLATYLYTYVWGLTGPVIAYLSISLFGGVIVAFIAAPRLGKRFGKPRTAMIAILLNTVLTTSPYWLRLIDAFPSAGSMILLPILFGFFICSTACAVTAFILAASMMADVVEDSEVKTGRRSEGLFFAGSFFVQKCTGGIGIFASGLILSAVAFPKQAAQGGVPIATLDHLTSTYGVINIMLAVGSAFFFYCFPFGRAEHEARVARLAGSKVG